MLSRRQLLFVALSSVLFRSQSRFESLSWDGVCRWVWNNQLQRWEIPG